jgi:hypothetical protein
VCSDVSIVYVFVCVLVCQKCTCLCVLVCHQCMSSRVYRCVSSGYIGVCSGVSAVCVT